jgi:hypothetical protein
MGKGVLSVGFTREIFRSVEDVWVVWLLGGGVLAWLIARAGRPRRWRHFASFLADERGASYALPYVLTFPFYVLLICVFIQATMILMVKMGSIYAAYAAARSAVVWRSAEPYAADDSTAAGFATDRAQRAAALAMTPMATSLNAHFLAVAAHRPFASPRVAQSVVLCPLYYGAYTKMLGLNVQSRSGASGPSFIPSGEFNSPASETYVAAKLRYALMATDVDLTIENNEFNADLKATVSYVMPMHVPGVGRFLGQGPASMYYARTITSSAVLPLETPLSDNKRLGIPYASESN